MYPRILRPILVHLSQSTHIQHAQRLPIHMWRLFYAILQNVYHLNNAHESPAKFSFWLAHGCLVIGYTVKTSRSCSWQLRRSSAMQRGQLPIFTMLPTGNIWFWWWQNTGKVTSKVTTVLWGFSIGLLSYKSPKPYTSLHPLSVNPCTPKLT